MTTDPHLEALQDRLLRRIEAYMPVRGRPAPPRPALIEAFRRYPRHLFLPRYRPADQPDGPALAPGDAAFLDHAYDDGPLCYVDDHGASLPASCSEPGFIFHLAELLDVRPGHRVLEVGCGTGWLLALLAHAAAPDGEALGVEIDPGLQALAARNLATAGVANAIAVTGDGLAAAGRKTFDRIIMTASAWQLPATVLTLLADDGIAVLPIQNKGLSQEIHVLRKDGSTLVSRLTRLCRFVPLTGRDGADADVLMPRLDADPDITRLPMTGLPDVLDFGQAEPERMMPPALAFTGWLSKLDPRFRAWRLGAGDARPSLFGDPQVHGFGLVDAAAGSAALWRAGYVTAYGDAGARDALFAHLARWTAHGSPTGYAFGLGITSAGAASPVSHPSHRERRGPLDFWWWLRPPAERF
ncbi:methyltransferase domain-containing protein [Tistrella mobilis]|uniref:protein-L-isoaspartate O-methyltransferase family protein n=1 Tax=Tistrella mobilis TaxID=171437 RepID=UPI003558922C